MPRIGRSLLLLVEELLPWPSPEVAPLCDMAVGEGRGKSSEYLAEGAGEEGLGASVPPWPTEYATFGDFVDRAMLAWLLQSFPVEPLPSMIEPLSVDELRTFRDALAERFRKLATNP